MKKIFNADAFESKNPDIANHEEKFSINLYDENDKKKSQSTLMIEIGEQGYLFHDDNMDAYAEFERDGIKSTMAIRSKEFTEFLSHELYLLTAKGANAPAITDAKNTLEAKSKYNGNQAVTAVRALNFENNVLIDTGCSQRRVIQINANGWNYTNNSPVKFVRKRGMTALPQPSTYGDIRLIEKYLNVSVNELPLIYAWLFCALAGVKPFPILILQGEQGTGKSTTSRVLRALVDPSSVPLRSPPKNVRDLLVSAGNNHVVTLDNLSGLNAELSDCLCRLSTGGGIDLRALFTDGEQYLADIQRPLLINGIDDIATRPDLAERAFVINLPVINSKHRRSEKEFWESFNQDSTKIFTGLLNGIFSGLRHVNDIVLIEKPRMADVAIWATACERELGMEGQFLAAHTKNQHNAIQAGIEASPVGTAIMELMSNRDSWTGTPTDLLNKLEQIAGDRQVRSKAWPQSTKGLNNIIKRLTPNFRKLEIEIIKKTSDDRTYRLERIDLQAPYPPEPPKTSQGKGYSSGGYKSQAPEPAVKRLSQADSESNRLPSEPINTGIPAHKADKAVNSEKFLKPRLNKESVFEEI